MGETSTAVRGALEPYVGPMVADTCVRATALSMGKMADDLTSEDLPALEANVRKLLAPIAPSGVIDDVIATLERTARGY